MPPVSRWMTHCLVALLFTLAAFAPARAQQPPARTFALGFTDVPHGLPFAPNDTRGAAWANIQMLGDMAVLHEDGLLPWQEALEQRYTDYPANYLAEIDYKAAQRNALPPGHKVFLYVNVMNWEKSAIAASRGPDGEAMPHPPFWEERKHRFDDPAVVTAFLHHLEFLVLKYRPDYIAYGIEVNLLLKRTKTLEVPWSAWESFVRGAYQLHGVLKAWHPTLPVFFSLQVDDFNEDAAFQFHGLAPVMGATDLIAVSAYPFARGHQASQLATDYLSAVRMLAPSKPFAIAETGWAAEPVFYPDPLPSGATHQYYLWSDEAAQASYVNHVLAVSDAHGALFVNWFVSRDYDEGWTLAYQAFDSASILRLWRDCGLLTGDGAVRWSAQLWLSHLSRPRL